MLAYRLKSLEKKTDKVGGNHENLFNAPNAH